MVIETIRKSPPPTPCSAPQCSTTGSSGVLVSAAYGSAAFGSAAYGSAAFGSAYGTAAFGSAAYGTAAFGSGAPCCAAATDANNRADITTNGIEFMSRFIKVPYFRHRILHIA